MMRIARDHGVLLSEVAKISQDEMVIYAAHYVHDRKLEEAERARLEKEREKNG